MGLEAVADAGPLIHLAEIGVLPALSIFVRLSVPETIWREVTRQKHLSPDDLLRLDNLQHLSLDGAAVDEFARAQGLSHLHSGEQASLYLCHTLHIPILLTDDLAARDAAQALAITPVGSLGVIVRAHRSGLFSLEAAEQYLFNLHDISTLFVTRAIVELAVKQLRAD